MTPFKQDVIDLFTEKRGGHVEQYLYSDTLRQSRTGSQLWHEFLKTHPDYYVLLNEIELIKNSASSISTHLRDINTIGDFGVGDGQALKQKIFPLLEEMPQIKNYVGLDLSQDFLNAAKANLKSERPEISFTSLERDFFNDKISSPYKKWFGLMLGSTISNIEMKEDDEFPRSTIVNRLKHLKSIIGEGNHFLPSYDANEDIKSIKQAYNSIYWSKFVTGIMYDVDKISYGDFSPNAWVHEMVWNPKSYVLHHCATSKIKQDFSIDKHDIQIMKGQRFVTVNTFKYPEQLFTSMTKEAGFDTRECYVDEQNRMRLPDLVC